MTKFDNLSLERRGSFLYIIINRPSKLNALNHQTVEEIREAIQVVYDENSIKGAILTGAGEKAFVAGADISEFTELSEVSSRKFAENGQEVFSMIENCPKPIIAAINGFALGGGCELAMACHLRVAVRSAQFAQPEVNLGIIPGYGGTQRLAQLIGKGKALELMMTADRITADEAKDLGLVNHVVEDNAELLSKAEELLSKIVLKAPIAIEMVINCVNAVYNKEEDGFQTEANSFSICCKSDDFKEGVKAFLEKRPARFQGR
jgi:enoyl-CoA hydratase